MIPIVEYLLGKNKQAKETNPLEEINDFMKSKGVAEKDEVNCGSFMLKRWTFSKDLYNLFKELHITDPDIGDKLTYKLSKERPASSRKKFVFHRSHNENYELLLYDKSSRYSDDMGIVEQFFIVPESKYSSPCITLLFRHKKDDKSTADDDLRDMLFALEELL